MSLKANTPNPIAEWLKPENDSVMEHPLKRGLRSVVNTGQSILGLDDPNAPFTGMMNPMETLAKAPLAGLITLFKNKAARLAATDAFKQSGAKLGLPNLDVAINTFADKYPRVAAHMRVSDKPPSTPGALAEVAIPSAGVYRPINMMVGAEGVDRMDNSAAEAMNAVFHEGTHVAQGLGNRRFGPLYRNATELVGYGPNPWEINARRAGHKAIGQAVGPYVPAHKQLQAIVDSRPSFEESLMNVVGFPSKKGAARKEISRILDSRK